MDQDKLSLYWQESYKLAKIAKAHAQKNAWQLISLNELSSGMLSGYAQKKILIAPLVAKKINGDNIGSLSSYLYLCWFSAVVDDTGRICQDKYLFPWFNQDLLDKFGPISFGRSAINDYYITNPMTVDDNSNFRTSLIYLNNLLQDLYGDCWKWHLFQTGYELIGEAAVLLQQDLLDKNDHAMLSWIKLLPGLSRVYTRQVESNYNYLSPAEITSCTKLYQVNAIAARLSSTQREIILQTLLLKQTCTVSAYPNTGKGVIIKNIVANQWLDALLNNITINNIAKIILIEHDNNYKLANIFDCIPEGTTWLDLDNRELVLKNKQMYEITKHFLQCCSDFFKTECRDLAAAQKQLLEVIKISVNDLTNIQQFAESYQTLKRQLSQKYSFHANISSYIAELESQFKDFTIKYDNLVILHDLLNSEIAKSNFIAKAFSNYVWGRNKKLKYLYDLIKEHPELQEIDKLSSDAVGYIILQLKDKVASALREAQQELNKAYNDFKELDLLEQRYNNWCENNFGRVINITELSDYLDAGLKNKIFILLCHYYEAKLLQEVYWEQSDFVGLIKQASDVNIFDIKIDLLIAPHANYITPQLGAVLLARSCKAIIFGNEIADLSEIVLNDNKLDELLLEELQLLENYELDDLDYMGVLATGNFYKLASNSDYNFRHFNLKTNWSVSKELVLLQNSLIPHKLEWNQYNDKKTLYPACNYFPSNGVSEHYLGSMRNITQAEDLIDWLLEAKNGIENFYEKKLNEVVIIITAFSEQRILLQKLLQQNKLNKISVYLFNEYCIETMPIVIFSSVYNCKDIRPFCFDEGERVMLQAIACATDSIIWFTDMKIFDKRLHSPSGKLARFLFKAKASCLLGEEFAIC